MRELKFLLKLSHSEPGLVLKGYRSLLLSTHLPLRYDNAVFAE